MRDDIKIHAEIKSVEIKYDRDCTKTFVTMHMVEPHCIVVMPWKGDLPKPGAKLVFTMGIENEE